MIEDAETGAVIGSKEEAAWFNIKEQLEQQDAAAKRQIEMNEVLLKFVNQKLKSLDPKKDSQ